MRVKVEGEMVGWRVRDWDKGGGAEGQAEAWVRCCACVYSGYAQDRFRSRKSTLCAEGFFFL